MRLPKDEIPVRVSAPGATARQLSEFGTPSGTFGVEYFSLASGTDIAPLLQGLPGDLCQSPHWGYVIAGDLTVSYADGSADRCVGGDVFFWPAGHSVRVARDAELILFSPQHEHGQVMDHLNNVLAASA